MGAPPKASPKLSPSKTASSPTNLSPEQQLDQDLQLAKALTENDAQQNQRDDEWETYKQTRLGDTSGLTDEELARRLQEEENSQMQERAAAAQPDRGAGIVPTGPSTSRGATGSGSPGRNQSGASSSSQRTKNCTIL